MTDQTENTEQTLDPEKEKRIEERVDPILQHLKVEGTEIDLDKFRKHFVQLWEYEQGDTQEPDEQRLTTIGLFIYTTHLGLDDYHMSIQRSREPIINALKTWLASETENAVNSEKATDNPFKAFVDNNISKVDEMYTWRHFLLEHKKSDETEWTYKMKGCWFADFFIRLGRTDFIETACGFDKIPSEARTDYVNLKLSNAFAKMGEYCQFKYTPVKK